MRNKMPTSKIKNFSIGNIAPIREDLIRALVLTLLVVLLWCASYNRWSVESWQTPLTYISEPEKGDAIAVLAQVKAAKDGHLPPLLFINVSELGAPFGANWNDFPITENIQFFLLGCVAKIIGVFAALNLAVMAAQVLAAIGFYVACRLLRCSWAWSFAGALVFAFTRYVFAQESHAITATCYWHVPLCLVVCRWIICGKGIRFAEPRFIFAIIVAFLTGIQHVYYTNMFAQFVLFGGLAQWWRQRDWKATLPAIAVIGFAAAAFFLVNLHTLIYHIIYGPNPGALVRAYKWLEIYGLKTVDLVVPPPDHRFSLFAAWGSGHLREIVLPPGEMPPTGYIGLVGIGALAWLALLSLRRVAENSKLPLETWQILWIMLYSDIGGVNGLIGTLGFQLFRATTRYSIFILCIVLMAAVRRLSDREFRKPLLSHCIVLPVVLIALWDQMPPQVSVQELEKTNQAVASDRHFTGNMEGRLPPNAMVFQIPIMEYPESPAPGVGSYDHFRPYLYSHHLRFSFGSDKGRPREKWQQQLVGLPLGEVVSKLEGYGFSAIYVNRNGFADKGEGLVKAFKEIGRAEMIESEKGDLFCVFLKPSPYPTLPATQGDLLSRPTLPGMSGGLYY